MVMSDCASQAKAQARLITPKIATAMVTVRSRPNISAAQPPTSAPTSWPRNAAEMIAPICCGDRCHGPASAGSAKLIANRSTASKKVAMPRMRRTRICQDDSGNRSSRAATMAAAIAVPAERSLSNPVIVSCQFSRVSIRRAFYHATLRSHTLLS